VMEIRRRTLGYVSQFLRVIPRVAARDIVAAPLRALGVPRDAAQDRAGRNGNGTFTAGGITTGSARFDQILDELVSLHANPLPPEPTNPDELQRFDPLVGVPVRRPAFKPFGANFNGARVHALRCRA